MNKFGKPLNASLFGGTALAIAYTSDVDKLQPEDVTIISINGTSPWTREVVYEIPRGLPPCPSGGCLVTWNWIHTALGNEGYGAEIVSAMSSCLPDMSDMSVIPSMHVHFANKLSVQHSIPCKSDGRHEQEELRSQRCGSRKVRG
jgi:hypothetical protein